MMELLFGADSGGDGGFACPNLKYPQSIVMESVKTSQPETNCQSWS